MAGTGPTCRASRAAWVAALTATCILALDLLSKAAVEARLDTGRHYWLVDGVIGLQRTTNRGIAFGMGGDSPFITAGVLLALLVLVLLMYRSGIAHRPGGAPVIAAIGGGGIGNLVDRLGDGSVTDFLAIGPWPRFNTADAALTCGILLFALIELCDRPALSE